MNCRECGHYITGGGCFQSGSQVKVDRNGSCTKWLPKDAHGTINHEQDLYDDRLKAV